MDKHTKDMLQGLKTAMEAELTGHEFYKNAAGTTTDAKGKETFLRMAGEEMGHFNFLRHQYEAVLEKGGYDLGVALLKKRYDYGKNPIFSGQIKERIKESHFEVMALTVGMKLELEAMKYYRSCAEKATLERVKEFFNELAAWEEDHYRAFEQELETLKEEYFAANRFAPM